jgi:hypothetical protein
MSRLQALVLALEISAFVWIGMFFFGKWIVDESTAYADFDISSALR